MSRKAKTRRWRFGVGQSSRDELRELREAQANGATDLYMQGQRHAELIAGEADRRAKRKEARRAAEASHCSGSQPDDAPRGNPSGRCRIGVAFKAFR